MKRSKLLSEQITAMMLEQQDGAKSADVCRKDGIGDATFYNWKAQHYGSRSCSFRALPLASWMQVETAIAGSRDRVRAVGAKHRMRTPLLVPTVLTPLAVMLALAALVRITTAVTDLPWAALVFGLIGAAFLPATFKVRGIPWLQHQGFLEASDRPNSRRSAWQRRCVAKDLPRPFPDSSPSRIGAHVFSCCLTQCHDFRVPFPRQCCEATPLISFLRRAIVDVRHDRDAAAGGWPCPGCAVVMKYRRSAFLMRVDGHYLHLILRGKRLAIAPQKSCDGGKTEQKPDCANQ